MLAWIVFARDSGGGILSQRSSGTFEVLPRNWVEVSRDLGACPLGGATEPRETVLHYKVPPFLAAGELIPQDSSLVGPLIAGPAAKSPGLL